MKFLLLSFVIGMSLLLGSAAAENTALPTEKNSHSNSVRPSSGESKAASHESNAPPTLREENEFAVFTPPTGWSYADPSALTSTIKVMVIGQAAVTIPPTITLAIEPYKSTAKRFLQTVKKINEANGHEWKDLGTIKTKAGTASLSQRDFPSKWGDIRMMDVVLVKNGFLYILSASSLKNEFPNYYNDFFSALRSLKIVKDLADLLSSPAQRDKLKTAVNILTDNWNVLLKEKKTTALTLSDKELKKEMFSDAKFQNTIWIPFTQRVREDFKNETPGWADLFLQKFEDRLLMFDS